MDNLVAHESATLGIRAAMVRPAGRSGRSGIAGRSGAGVVAKRSSSGSTGKLRTCLSWYEKTDCMIRCFPGHEEGQREWLQNPVQKSH